MAEAVLAKNEMREDWFDLSGFPVVGRTRPGTDFFAFQLDTIDRPFENLYIIFTLIISASISSGFASTGISGKVL